MVGKAIIPMARFWHTFLQEANGDSRPGDPARSRRLTCAVLKSQSLIYIPLRLGGNLSPLKFIRSARTTEWDVGGIHPPA